MMTVFALNARFGLFKETVMYLDDKAPVAFEGVEGVARDELSPLVTVSHLIRLYGGVVSPTLNQYDAV